MTSDIDYFSSPKESAIFIAENSEHVQVDQSAIGKLSSLIASSLPYNVPYEMCEMPESDEKRLANWCFFVSSINFSFWPDVGDQFNVTHENRQETGYLALCALFKIAIKILEFSNILQTFFKRNIPILDCDFYLSSSYENIKSIFIGDDNRLIPMFDDRYNCLIESARVLKEKFDGSFLECLKIANSSAKALLSLILENFASFRDVSRYKGKTVSLLKRAQILVSDVHQVFNGRKPANFMDLDCLTMFADYRVPQVLAYFGVLKYDEALTRTLNENRLLKNGDLMEVEIRGCSIFAVEKTVEKVNEILANGDSNTTEINAAWIDHFLWNYRRSNAKEIEDKFPYHRTRCIYY